MEITIEKDIVVLYHAHCQDGFGAAYAAWKKLGESAQYVPWSNRSEPPAGLSGKEVYILDFSFNRAVLQKIHAEARSLKIIDHHISAYHDVMSVPGTIYADDKSGALLSWEYFVPGEPVPHLFVLLDLMDRHKDDKREFDNEFTYINSQPFTFSAYEHMVKMASTQSGRATMKDIGSYQRMSLMKILEMVTHDPDMVEFQGYTVPAVNIALPINEKSEVQAYLYGLGYPFSISYRIDDGLVKVSLRGTGEVDLTVLAGVHGGGGHKGSSGFVVPYESGIFEKLWKWVPKVVKD